MCYPLTEDCYEEIGNGEVEYESVNRGPSLVLPSAACPGSRDADDGEEIADEGHDGHHRQNRRSGHRLRSQSRRVLQTFYSRQVDSALVESLAKFQRKRELAWRKHTQVAVGFHRLTSPTLHPETNKLLLSTLHILHMD